MGTRLRVVVRVLAAAEGDEGSGHDHRHDAHDEGEDGGEEEDPPLALLQALLLRQHRHLVREGGLHLLAGACARPSPSHSDWEYLLDRTVAVEGHFVVRGRKMSRFGFFVFVLWNLFYPVGSNGRRFDRNLLCPSCALG